MNPQALQDILRRDSVFGSLNARMQSLATLQQAWQAALPPGLRAHSRVIGTEDRCLLVQTENSAMAAKLRQLAPSLTRAVARVFPELESLRIRVASPESRPAVRHRPAQPLSPEALEHFKKLYGTLAPSPLKTAIEHLLETRRD
ncbi:MAG: DUF721 domain-containing protein [Betaproteobacteria bacterium]|nr:DUF721 domain-containing protein [Betaproteobacteria bacterium]